MKHFSGTDTVKKEDIQIQIPCARIGFKLSFVSPEGLTFGSRLGLLDAVRVRLRLVSPSFGTRTVIERMTLRTLLEISSSGQGFYEINENPDVQNTSFQVSGSIEIARGGALALTNQSYLSLDIESDTIMGTCEIESIPHPKTTNTYLHYNPVTITAGLQNIPLSKAIGVVIPFGNVEQIQLKYPNTVVEHSREGMKHVQRTINDIVYFNTLNGQIKAGFDRLCILPTQDMDSGFEASMLQVEPAANAGQFNVYLLEEGTL
jgi:hypothetical protein